ncbi:hypothetical protein ACFROC_22930 [Nocardia tengchongensis]|uniref:hypothetical protein n=1 Tax=Nocardia tengchongensis TaxID=2055889 RepID=UPI00367A2C26
MVRNPARAATSAARNTRKFLRALDARAEADKATASAPPARPTVRVLGANRDNLEDTEAQVLAALRGWNIPAVAVSGAKVPVTRTDPITREKVTSSADADILLILPHGAIAIEVKGLVRRLGGVLYCPLQGDWSLPGIPGDPVHSQQGGNPCQQAERVMYGFKNFAKTATNTKVFVDAVVMVVPWEGLPLTLDKGPIPMPPGQDVLIADPTAAELFAWYSRRARRRKDIIWTAERVATVLDALGYTSTNRDPDTRTSVAELAALGFPSTTAAAWPTPEAEYPVTMPADPAPDPRDTARPARPARPAPSPARAPKRPQRAAGRPRRGLARLAVAVLAWAGLFGGGAALLTHHHDLTPSVPTPTSTQAPTPTEPAGGPAACYPLQPC